MLEKSTVNSMYNIIGINETNSVDFIKSTFDAFLNGKIVVFTKNEDATIPNLNIIENLIPKTDGGWIEFNQSLIFSDKPAQIVFTSGTEGKPKSILLTHNNLSNTVTRLNKIMGIDSSIREYVGIPVHYSFGFARCRAVAAVDGKAYIPESGFNPVEIKNMLKEGLINAISAVPTLWRMLLENKDFLGTLGRKIKWIEIGSQYMSSFEKEQMIALFPNATIVQHYGLTEASRTTFLVINETNKEYLESVGNMSTDIEIKLTDTNRIMIKGSNVAAGMFTNDGFTSITDENDWLLTNDLGHIKNGYLFFDGRTDDLINCGGIKINPDLLQSRLESNLDIQGQIAISKYPCPKRGDGVLIASLDTSTVDKNMLLQELTTVLESFSVKANSSICHIQIEKFPLTSTGKIKRSELSKLYSADDIDKRTPNLSTDEHKLFYEYANVFSTLEVKRQSTFSGLGGDSLNYVQISMSLESYLGFLPHGWENMTIQNLIEIKPIEKSIWSEIESSIVMRVIAIVAVVLTHSDFNYAGGGTLLLFVLIGYNMGRFKHKEFTMNGVWNWLLIYSVKILIPYMILASIFIFYKNEFDITTLLLVTNLIELKLNYVFPFLFVQVLLQCLIILGVMFSFPKIRKSLNDSPWKTAIIILLTFITIRAFYPFIWDTDYLRNLVPQRFILLIWLGYTLSLADTSKHKGIIAFLGIVIALIDVRLSFQLHWVIIGSVVLAFLPTLKIPKVTKSIVNNIANSTFYIFIFNGIIIALVLKIIHLESRLLVALITLVMAVMIWKVSEHLQIEKRVLKLFKKMK